MRRVSTCNFTVHILIVSLLSCLTWSSFNNPKTILTLVMMGQLFLLLALVATRFHIKPCVFEKDGMTWTDISCGLHSKGNWGLLQTRNGLKSFMKNHFNFYFDICTFILLMWSIWQPIPELLFFNFQDLFSQFCRFFYLVQSIFSTEKQLMI